MKKSLLIAGLLVLTVFCTTACGRRMNSATDGTDKNVVEDNMTNDTTDPAITDVPEKPANPTVEDNTMKDEDYTHTNDGVTDGIVNGVEDTVDGVVDGVEDVIEGTENTIDRNTNSNTLNDGNVNEQVLPDNNDNVVNDGNNVNDERRIEQRP